MGRKISVNKGRDSFCPTVALRANRGDNDTSRLVYQSRQIGVCEMKRIGYNEMLCGDLES